MMKLQKFKRILLILFVLFIPFYTVAFPVYSKYAYPNPRADDGTLSCANCHLGKISFNAAIPTVILPGRNFNLKVKVPCEPGLLQISADGSSASLLVGILVILPKNFGLSRKGIEESSILILEGIDPSKTIQPYSERFSNVLVIGPVFNKKSVPKTSTDVFDASQLDNTYVEEDERVPTFSLREFKFSVSPPSLLEGLRFSPYSVIVGANLGRGQVYPSGVFSNNNPYVSKKSGLVRSIRVTKSDRTIVSNRPTLSSFDYDSGADLLNVNKSVPCWSKLSRTFSGRTSTSNLSGLARTRPSRRLYGFGRSRAPTKIKEVYLPGTNRSGKDCQTNQFDSFLHQYVLSVKPKKQILYPGAIIPLSMPFFVENGNEMTIDPNMGGFAQRVYGIRVQQPQKLVACVFLSLYISFIQILFAIKRFQYFRSLIVEL